jgi:acetolactate synthase-1/2/3 large subunit
VVVDLPKDVQNPKEKFPYQYPESVSLRSYNPTKAGHKGQIKRAAKLLTEASRPVMYVGGGAINANADHLVTKLAELLNLPVTTTLMGLGAFSGTHPQFIGMLGMHGTFEANKSMHNADLIFAVGARFDDRVTNNVSKFCPNATIVHIDIDPTSISKTVQAHVPIVGSVETVLEQMLEVIRECGFDNDKQALADWWSQIDQWRSRNCLAYETHPTLIKPQQVIEALYKVTKGEAFVASDVGQHQMFAALYYPFAKPRQWINSGGLGTMGFGIPAAMGAQFANPDAVVCCVTGDGSVQMNIQELSTCMQYGVPIKIISINNRALGMVKQWQKMFYGGRHSHSYMESLPDFVKLAEAYGHVGIAVSDPAELESAMEKAFAMKDRLVFMDISVDPDEHVYPMQIKFGAMDEMWLSKTERT